jgi:hypothetical protein
MWDDVLLYVIIGFVAQMIDGAIGMAYGVTASSVLLGLGVLVNSASAEATRPPDAPWPSRNPLALEQSPLSACFLGAVWGSLLRASNISSPHGLYSRV